MTNRICRSDARRVGPLYLSDPPYGQAAYLLYFYLSGLPAVLAIRQGAGRYSGLKKETNILEHILSLSYGKDSLACLGAIEKLGLPLDRIIHAEIWATDTIPADLPPMVEFKAKADKIIKERYGITVEHVCSTNIDGVKGDKITFEDGFYHVLNSGKHAGNIKGFPMQQGQWCQKLKLSAVKTANDIFYSKRQRGNRVGQ